MTSQKKVSLNKYVNPNIADDLTTNDATKVLSAKQGKKLQDEKVAISQGSGNNGKFLKVDSSGNVACESVTIPAAYSHPPEKQCNAAIPSAGTTTPSADVSGGAVGISSNYAKADHQHPLSSAYAPASHNQNLSTINNVTTMAVVITYTDSTSETKNLVVYTGS